MRPMTPEERAAFQEAARRGVRVRQEWLRRIATHDATIFDLALQAMRPEGKPLRSIRLAYILEHDPVFASKGAWRTMLAELQRRTYVDRHAERRAPLHELRVSWLVHEGAGSRRTQHASSAWRYPPRLFTLACIYLEALQSLDAPFPGFPWRDGAPPNASARPRIPYMQHEVLAPTPTKRIRVPRQIGG